MGTTIRRQPVKFDIPRSPDYKFLNITNFRGLDISSNPFELASNTASDCLNVYVDETNTLTTRPRLELFVNAPIDGDHIGTYNLHDGYLLHYNKYNRDENTHEIVDKTPTMWFFKNGKLADKQVSGTIPTEKCNYFEQGDKIYLLDGERYMVISENSLSDVDGYVPTTTVVDVKGNRKSVEALNILSDKYIEEYHWDGISKPTYDAVDVINVENNNYVTRDNLYNSTDAPLYRHLVYVAYDDGLLASPKYSENDDGVIYYFKTTDKFATVTKTSTGIKGVPLVCATKQKLFWYINDKKLLKFVYYNKDSEKWIESSSSYDLSTVGSYKAVVSADGECLFFINYTNDTFTFFLRNTDDTFSSNAISTGNYNFAETSTPSGARNLTINNFYITNTQPYTVAMSVGVYGAIESPIIIVCDSVDKKMTKIASIPGSAWSFKGMTLDGSLMYFVLAGKLLTISNFDESTKTQYKGAFGSSYHISEDGQYAYMLQKKGSYYDINILPTYYDTNVMVPMNVSVYVSTDTYDPTKYYNSIKEYMRIEPTKMIFSQYKNYGFYQTAGYGQLISVWNPDDFPKLTLTKRLNSQSPQYATLLDKRQSFLKSKLYTRFDNNYWVTSNNKYYRSQYNDPTYFPTTEYNDLGDSNEEITGFNLANDTTLIAYKKNKIYLIQPFTSSQDKTEYTITESKNTVGNTASGAPIVTTLTEIPLQINNDGIYGLSQMANVSSTERIADLMSEPINEKWLDIPEQYIANIKTLNRLYWTYIVIPRPDKNNTWIYILDNRTNSWYYWELPIVTVNAFAKDNRAEFVDINGNIYYLTTEDIINKAYETLVTEYYDVGNKLIPWYWQSQILPLGTINYSKRLVNTTFVLTDTDNIDGYGLNYSFKVFRKLASSVADTEMSGDLNLVRSTTKKTNISRFGFIQLKLSNIDRVSDDGDDQTIKAYRNNKLRLVGLGLKYVLLEGLIK